MQFSELYAAVEDVLKLPGGSKRDIAKHAVNMAYIEMMFNDSRYPPYWLYGPTDQYFHAPKDVTGAIQAAECVITSTAHGFVGGEVVTFWDVGGMTELDYDYANPTSAGRFFMVDSDGLAADTFKLLDTNGDAVNSTTFTAYTSGGKIHHHGWRLTSLIHTVHRVGFYENNQPLDPMTWEEFLERPDYWVSDQTTTPHRFIHTQLYASDGDRMDYILTLPAAQEDEIAYALVTVKPLILSADADVPLMPPEHHYGIVAGAVMRLSESNVQVENAVVWPGIYRANVANFNAYNYRLWETAGQGKKPFGL